ncbi:MAG: helix-turn-helix domain-containing protein [Fluviicola sp.]
MDLLYRRKTYKLFTMLDITLKYILLTFIFLQGSILSWHLIDLMIKTYKRSDWKFLLLIAGFLLFNVSSFYTFFEPGAIDIRLQLVLANGCGVVLAMFYAVYLSIKFNKREENKSSTKFLLPILIGTYFSGIFIAYIFDRNYRNAESLLLALPAVLSIAFCVSLQVRLRKLGGVKITREKMIMFYSSYGAIVLMSANPLVSVVTGYNGLNVSLINILFLLTVATYVYQLALEHREESQALARIGFFADPRSIFAYELSKRQLEVASMMLRDKTFADIAEELSLAPNTVSKHASDIYRKTNTVNVDQFKQKFAPFELPEQVG